MAKMVVPIFDFNASWRGSRKYYKLCDFAKAVLGEYFSARAHNAESDADCLARTFVESYKSLREKTSGNSRDEEREGSPRR